MRNYGELIMSKITDAVTALAQPVAPVEETVRDVYTDIIEEGRDR
jgi:hypothetical protein